MFKLMFLKEAEKEIL